MMQLKEARTIVGEGTDTLVRKGAVVVGEKQYAGSGRGNLQLAIRDVGAVPQGFDKFVASPAGRGESEVIQAIAELGFDVFDTGERVEQRLRMTVSSYPVYKIKRVSGVTIIDDRLLTVAFGGGSAAFDRWTGRSNPGSYVGQGLSAAEYVVAIAREQKDMATRREELGAKVLQALSGGAELALAKIVVKAGIRDELDALQGIAALGAKVVPGKIRGRYRLA